jgi:gp6-like head-tail connector protein
MRYNDVIDVEVVTDITAEPVTLAEVKRHLSLQFDTSGSYQFDDDDTRITDLITQCREELEQYTGLSFAEKTLKAILRNDCGGIEIPFGPVTALTSVKDVDGNTLTATTQYTARGNQFKWIEFPCSCYLEVNYTSGYTALPAGLKRALLEEIAFRYKNAGDQEQQFANGTVTLCQSALELAARYSRKSLIA